MPGERPEGKHMTERSESKEWIRQAEEDLDAANYNFLGGRLKFASFLCQQAAEKALKAVQINVHGRFDKVHDLLTLAQSIDAPQGILESCLSLTTR